MKELVCSIISLSILSSIYLPSITIICLYYLFIYITYLSVYHLSLSPVYINYLFFYIIYLYSYLLSIYVCNLNSFRFQGLSTSSLPPAV